MVVVVLIIVIGAAYLYVGSPVSTSATTTPTQLRIFTNYNSGAMPTTTTSTTVTPDPNAIQVVMSAVNGEPGDDGNAQFNPQVITVVIGVNNTVIWTNQDQVPHNILTTSGFSSGDLSTGQTYTFRFTQAGTYHYFCSYYPIMAGVVVVKNP